MVQVEKYGSYATDKPLCICYPRYVRAADSLKSFFSNAIGVLIFSIMVLMTWFGLSTSWNRSRHRQTPVARWSASRNPVDVQWVLSGWFDHWGRKYETRPEKWWWKVWKEMIRVFRSVCIWPRRHYFGWWVVPIIRHIPATCSSYDHDAPTRAWSRLDDRQILPLPFAICWRIICKRVKNCPMCLKHFLLWEGTCHQVYTDCSVNQQSPDTETDRRYQTDGENSIRAGNHSLPH